MQHFFSIHYCITCNPCRSLVFLSLGVDEFDVVNRGLGVPPIALNYLKNAGQTNAVHLAQLPIGIAMEMVAVYSQSLRESERRIVGILALLYRLRNWQGRILAMLLKQPPDGVHRFCYVHGMLSCGVRGSFQAQRE